MHLATVSKEWRGVVAFAAATPDGRRSVTVSASEQLNTTTLPHVWQRLRHAELLGVCAAMAR
jgi:hypothetical protein